MNNIIKEDNGDYIKFEVAPKKTGKKYKATVYDKKGYKIRTSLFGSDKYEHYEDSTPLKAWSSKDHKDKKRRGAYRARHSKILNKNKEPAYKDKYSPAWFSYYFLWN